MLEYWNKYFGLVHVKKCISPNHDKTEEPLKLDHKIVKAIIPVFTDHLKLRRYLHGIGLRMPQVLMHVGCFSCMRRQLCTFSATALPQGKPGCYRGKTGFILENLKDSSSNKVLA